MSVYRTGPKIGKAASFCIKFSENFKMAKTNFSDTKKK